MNIQMVKFFIGIGINKPLILKNKGVYRIHMNRKWKKMLTSKIKTTKKIEYYE